MKPKLNFENKLILAPMVKIGTLPMRLLAIKYGADIVYTEEIIDWRLINSERILNPVLDTVDYVDKSDSTLILRISPKERGHLVLQIGTSDPERAVTVAKKVINDVDGIDVNMGCPKAFSIKGGMGAALLSEPQKIKSILTSLVTAVGHIITVTCKIRIFSNLEETLNLVRLIQTTGISALAVHGRTKDERPNHANHTDVIREVKKIATIPIIANGGSANNRDLYANTHEGILDFWKESTADSVMIARAAEWNVSVFSKKKEDIYTIIDEYLDMAIRYDYPFAIVKYNIQQVLGSDQDTERGRKFLSTGTLLDLCTIFDKGTAFSKRQEELTKLKLKHPLGPREAVRTGVLPDELAPKKRKLSSCFPQELFQPSWDSNEDVTVMFAPYVRTHYLNPIDIPKARLLAWYRSKTQSSTAVPSYETIKTKDKVFQSIVRVGEFGAFGSLAAEKNKRYSEQAAAIVALHCLDIKKFVQDATINL